MKLLNVDTVEQVREKLASHFGNQGRKAEFAGIGEAVGRYAADDIAADADMPGFRRSVVDGYAVRAKETYGVSDSIPVFLRIAGSVEMGKIHCDTLRSGEAVYVPTGGMIPEGADAVVMIEYIDCLDEGTIAIYKPAAPGSGIMNVGDDYRQGDILFRKGHRMSVKDIGMLAACGLSRIPVYAKPVLSIISTGDEIVEIGASPLPGQIRDINGHAVRAFAEAAGAAVSEIRIFHDDFDVCRSYVADEIKKSDLVLISGGSSAGNKDMTADIIDSLGEPGVFTHGIAIKPGKPTIIGDAGGKPVFGLPGHPMSAIIVFKAVVEPFIKNRFFGNDEEALGVPAWITENIHAGEGRETYQLVTLEKTGKGWQAEPIRAKSGAISQLMKADGYIRIGALTEGVSAGMEVEVTLL